MNEGSTAGVPSTISPPTQYRNKVRGSRAKRERKINEEEKEKQGGEA